MLKNMRLLYNKQLLFPLCFILTTWLMSCMKDKGTYDYTSINRVDIQRVDSNYVVDYGKRLTITPHLTFSKDEQEDTVNYTYQWVANNLVGYTMLPEVISRQRNLDTVIKLGFGTYNSYYRVTDKRTGVFTDWYFNLTVSSPSYEGWMLLCDMENGNSRLDMISRRGNTETVYQNILQIIGSAFRPAGKPVFIATENTTIGPSMGAEGIFMATTTQATLLGPDTLEYLPSYELKSFMDVAEPISNWIDARLYLRLYGAMLYVNKRLYRGGSSDFTGPINTQDNSTALFTPSSLVGFNYINSDEAIVFNEDTKTFLRYPGSGKTCLSLPTGTLFSFSTGMDLLFCSYVPYNSGEVFAILKQQDSSKKYLARFTIKGEQRYYAEITGDNIDNAEYFAVSPDLGYLFYNAGGKVYEYDPALNKSILMKDYGSRKITVLRFWPNRPGWDSNPSQKYYNELSRKLIICTYIPGDPASSGNVDLFTVPDINAPLSVYKSYTGTGKVADITYRKR